MHALRRAVIDADSGHVWPRRLLARHSRVNHTVTVKANPSKTRKSRGTSRVIERPPVAPGQWRSTADRGGRDDSLSANGGGYIVIDVRGHEGLAATWGIMYISTHGAIAYSVKLETDIIDNRLVVDA